MDKKESSTNTDTKIPPWIQSQIDMGAKNQEAFKKPPEEKNRSTSFWTIIGYIMLCISVFFLFVDWKKALFYFCTGFMLSKTDVLNKKNDSND